MTLNTSNSPADRPPGEVVFASAGSGKTYQLTGRFLAHLARGEDPAAILACTFTRTAAGEILQRVVERLADACAAGDKRAELSIAIDQDLTADRCAELLETILRNLHRLNIGTIDSLFARLTSAFALDLAVAPGWRIAETEIDFELRERALDLTLESEADAARIIEMLLGGERRSIRKDILQCLGGALDEIRDLGPGDRPWEALRPRVSPLEPAQLEPAVQALQQMPLPSTRSGKPDQRWQRALGCMVACAKAGDWEGLLEPSFAGVADGAPYYGHQPTEAQRSTIAPIVGHARAEELWRHYRRSTARRDLARRFDYRYSALKRREGLLQFDDLPRLLLEAKVLGDLDEVYFRLDARTRHVLLDEFQDTSILQFRLLEPILDEILAQSDGRSVFVVGDAKQSLFGWRNAEPELLAAVAHRWPALQPRTLAKSWRSSQTVLDVVNTVFEDLQTNAAIGDEPAAARWRNRFEPHTAAKDLPGRVRLSEAAPIDDEESPLDAALRIARDRAREIHHAHPSASIAIIVRRNSTIGQMVALLRDAGLGASEEGGSPLTDCAPVVAALSLIHLADHPGDTASLYHVATSPIGDAIGLTDHLDLRAANRKARALRARIAARGLARVLASIADNIAARIDHREAERFERLVDLAQEFDASSWTRLDRFLDMVRCRRIESPEPASIRVMTIHKAKGLEFDAVILPELDESIEPRPGGILVQRDGPLGEVQRACVAPKASLRRLDDRLETVYQCARQRHLEEGLSQLYVAMTRARCALEMIVQQGPRTRQLSHAKILRAALPVSPATSLFDASSALFEIGTDDWSTDRSTDAPAPPQPEPVTLRLRERDTPLASRLARRSATESQRIRIRDRLTLAESPARRRGSIFHAWLEAIEWLDDADLSDQQLARIAHDAGFDDALDCAEDFRRSLAQPETKALLTRPEGQTELWRERPFAIRSGPSLISGRFDRVAIHRVSDAPVSAHVIDFKTDGPAQLDGLADRYAPQMNAYRAAAATLLALPEQRIRCSLVLLQPGRVLDVPPTPPSTEPTTEGQP